MPGFGTADVLAHDEPILPQLERFGAAAVEWMAPEGGAVVSGNSLGGCVSLLLAERDDLGLAGYRARRPRRAGHGAVVRRDRARAAAARGAGMRRCRCPRSFSSGIVGEVYKRLAFHGPGNLEPLITSTFASHFADKATTARLMATGRRLIGELRDPFRLEAIDCPVLMVWGRQDVMVFQTGADRVLGAVGHSQLGDDRGLRALPPAGEPRPADAAASDFPAADAAAIAS